jgi:predicted GNAT family N-acyltransferase
MLKLSNSNLPKKINMNIVSLQSDQINQAAEILTKAVSQHYRGKKIAHNLIKLAIANAINQGYQTAVSIATNPTSSHIHRKFGFKDCFEIPYKTFIYESQEVFASITDSIVFMDRSLI